MSLSIQNTIIALLTVVVVALGVEVNILGNDMKEAIQTNGNQNKSIASLNEAVFQLADIQVHLFDIIKLSVEKH